MSLQHVAMGPAPIPTGPTTRKRDHPNGAGLRKMSPRLIEGIRDCRRAGMTLREITDYAKEIGINTSFSSIQMIVKGIKDPYDKYKPQAIEAVQRGATYAQAAAAAGVSETTVGSWCRKAGSPGHHGYHPSKPPLTDDQVMAIVRGGK